MKTFTHMQIAFILALLGALAPIHQIFAATASSGFDSTTDPLYISANGTKVLTITGSTLTTKFEGPITVTGLATISSGATVTGTVNVTGPINVSGLATVGSLSSGATTLSSLTVNGLTTINGNAQINGAIVAQDYFYTSDMRLKDNIHTVKGLDTIEKLKGVSFTWKKDHTPSAGILAQDVEKIMPDAVRTRDDGYKVVEYSQLVAPMIEAIKELKAENDLLAARVKRLENNADPTHKAALLLGAHP